MKHVSILSLFDATLTSIDSSHQIFTRVNDFMKYQGRPPFYEVEIVGLSQNMKNSDGLYTIHVNKTIDEISQTDLIVLPLLCGNFPEAIKRNEQYKDWLLEQHRHGAEILCLCVGSFF